MALDFLGWGLIHQIIKQCDVVICRHILAIQRKSKYMLQSNQGGHLPLAASPCINSKPLTKLSHKTIETAPRRSETTCTFAASPVLDKGFTHPSSKQSNHDKWERRGECVAPFAKTINMGADFTLDDFSQLTKTTSSTTVNSVLVKEEGPMKPNDPTTKTYIDPTSSYLNPPIDSGLLEDDFQLFAEYFPDVMQGMDQDHDDFLDVHGFNNLSSPTHGFSMNAYSW